jgi:hypothetical protein
MEISSLIKNKQLIETRNFFLFIIFRPKDKFDKKDIIRILTELNFPYSKPEVDQWIW